VACAITRLLLDVAPYGTRRPTAACYPPRGAGRRARARRPGVGASPAWARLPWVGDSVHLAIRPRPHGPASLCDRRPGSGVSGRVPWNRRSNDTRSRHALWRHVTRRKWQLIVLLARSVTIGSEICAPTRGTSHPGSAHCGHPSTLLSAAVGCGLFNPSGGGRRQAYTGGSE
jgi:hypothetical protein